VIAQGLKHFAIVGLVFALAIGWLLTFVANSVLGNVLEAVLHRPPDELYWGALLLTAVSMSLITVATLVGTRVARSRGWLSGLSRSALTLSSLLFVALVFAFNVPSLAELAQRFYEHMSYTYEHPGEAWMMLSLPLVRLIGLPLAYVVIGRRLFAPTQVEPAAHVAA